MCPDPYFFSTFVTGKSDNVVNWMTSSYTKKKRQRCWNPRIHIVPTYESGPLFRYQGNIIFDSDVRPVKTGEHGDLTVRPFPRRYHRSP